MSSPWRDMVAQMDATIDGLWGEQLRFLPWIPGEYDDGEPDLSRAVLTTVGILRLDNETVTGGGPNERTGKTFATRMAIAPIRASVAAGAGGQLLRNIREGDRMRSLAPERAGTDDEWFEIERLAPDASGRMEIHLKRLGKP